MIKIDSGKLFSRKYEQRVGEASASIKKEINGDCEPGFKRFPENRKARLWLIKLFENDWYCVAGKSLSVCKLLTISELPPPPIRGYSTSCQRISGERESEIAIVHELLKC
jgi:hypothetical protein